jgi:hypothetical protein
LSSRPDMSDRSVRTIGVAAFCGRADIAVATHAA